MKQLGFDYIDGRISKLHAKYISSNNMLCKQLFDTTYGELVDRIIHALENDLPTYTIPDSLSNDLCTKGKLLHEPKYSELAAPFHMDNKLIKGGEQHQKIGSKVPLIVGQPSDTDIFLTNLLMSQPNPATMAEAIAAIKTAKTPSALPFGEFLIKAPVSQEMVVQDKKQ